MVGVGGSRFHGQGERGAWTWTSAPVDLGVPMDRRKVYHVVVDVGGLVHGASLEGLVVEVSADERPFSGCEAEVESGVAQDLAPVGRFAVPEAHRDAYAFRVRVSGPGALWLRRLGVVVRAVGPTTHH